MDKNEVGNFVDSWDDKQWKKSIVESIVSLKAKDI